MLPIVKADHVRMARRCMLSPPGREGPAPTSGPLPYEIEVGSPSHFRVEAADPQGPSQVVLPIPAGARGSASGVGLSPTATRRLPGPGQISTESGRSTERGAGSTERGRDPRSKSGPDLPSANPTESRTRTPVFETGSSCLRDTSKPCAIGNKSRCDASASARLGGPCPSVSVDMRPTVVVAGSSRIPITGPCRPRRLGARRGDSSWNAPGRGVS